MLGINLSDFIKENVQRTASLQEQKNVIDTVENIARLTPREIGHLLYIFASCERAHKFTTSAITHFKHIKSMLKKVAFELKCDLCF